MRRTAIVLLLGVLASAGCWGPSQVFRLVEDTLLGGSLPGGGDPAAASSSAAEVEYKTCGGMPYIICMAWQDRGVPRSCDACMACCALEDRDAWSLQVLVMPHQQLCSIVCMSSETLMPFT